MVKIRYMLEKMFRFFNLVHRIFEQTLNVVYLPQLLKNVIARAIEN